MDKINARDCVVCDISHDTEYQFLDVNHSQGYTKSDLAYGLYYKNELVQIMTFGRPRFNKNYQWEIIRDCTKKGLSVNGGTSKLWKHFIENNNVRSCICYSYPHDENILYTNKYVDFCGFKNIERAKPEKKVYFEGIWNGKTKRIDKSLLARHGVDRLLGTNYGTNNGANEDILINLGFVKKYKDGYSPQKDSYLPFSVVYRIDDSDSGVFYIGETTSELSWNNGYMGSGSSKWQNHLKSHPDIKYFPDAAGAHHYKRTILASGFATPKELFDAELKEIKKYAEVDSNGKWKIADVNCMNYKVGLQSESINRASVEVCPECGGKNSHHNKSCSKYKANSKCPECGSTTAHRKGCSHYKEPEICPECGGIGNRHKKTCKQYKSIEACPECGCIKSHKKTCSHYTAAKPCPECGKIRSHSPECSHYKAPKPCPECGSIKGHKTDCSRNIKQGRCPECGNSLKSNTHKSWCSHYKEKKRPNPCPECGGVYNHKATCSKSRGFCLECGASLVSPHHRPGCSKYRPSKVCLECGGKNGRHYKTCSKYKRPKESKRCEECGCSHGKHLSSCSHSKGVCPHCGNSLQSNHHKPDCPLCKTKS